MDTSNSWFVILNPKSGNGIMKKKKQFIQPQLNDLTRPFSVNYTQYSGHEIELIKEGINQGYRKFISIGGDGTLHHVVNGVMIHGKDFLHEIKIGIIPVGTGNDWAKHYSIPSNPEKNIEILNQEKTVLQDIGKITHNQKDVYFNNLAGLGFDGYVVNKILSFKKLGKSAYFFASLSGLLFFKKPSVTLNFNNQSITSNIYLVGIGLCKYCGGGMRLTHQSNPTDGLFDVTIVKDISKLGFIWNIRKMFNGKLHQHPKVKTFKTNKLSISSNETNPLIQTDGELIGEGGFEVEIIQNAINFVVIK